MAKRELSSTLRNLKFMQRAAQREEKTKREEDVKPDGSFFSPGTLSRKCVVIIEGDPHPGAVKGRMSFLSFNPSVDKLNEEAANLNEPAACVNVSDNQSGRVSLRENGSPQEGAECSNSDKVTHDANGDLKRKPSEVVSEQKYPNKSPKHVDGGQQSSPSNRKGSNKHPKHEKLDWSVLRPSKNHNKKGEHS